MRLLKYFSKLIDSFFLKEKSEVNSFPVEDRQSEKKVASIDKEIVVDTSPAVSLREVEIESEVNTDSVVLEQHKDKLDIFFVDDNQLFVSKLLEQIQKSNKDVEFIPHVYIPIDLHGLSKDINEIVQQSSKAVVFINIDLKFGAKSRQSQIGVEVLLWLRCKWGVKNPVILYSFQSLGQLLRHMPEHLVITSEGCYFFQLPNDFDKPLPSLVNVNMIRKYIKLAFSIENFRHREANWFGVYKLFLIHNQINIETKEDQIEPELIFPSNLMNKVNSLETAIHQFLYLQPSSQKNEELNKDLIEKILEKKQELRKLNNPRIMYLDDMAHLGWGKLLQLMIYGGENKNFLIFNLSSYKNMEEIKKGVFDCIRSFRPKCLLLDLRLLDENGKVFDASELSGYQILKYVKSTLPSLPVIMFTASNKANTFKELIQLGCDFLWTKEGIDDMYDNHLSLRNYLQLLEYLYRSLTKFKDRIEENIYVTQIKLEELKNKELPELKLEFVQKKFIVFIDTNIWLHDNVDKVHIALYILLKNYQKLKLKFVIINEVYDEIIRISKEKLGALHEDRVKKVNAINRDNVRKIARFAETLLQSYNDANLFIKHPLALENDEEIPSEYNRKAYADNIFEYPIKTLISNKYNVLFITNDYELTNRINESLKGIRKAKGECAIWKSDDLINFIAESK